MSEEEYDYMSDNILTQCVEDVKPGLIQSRAKQRLIEITRKQAEEKLKNKPLKVVEAERRNEGLNNALDSANKGFSLLQKMGYKPGQGIGKDKTGQVEPVEINLKSNREGLGRKSYNRPLKSSSEVTKLSQESVLDYRRQKSKNAENKRDLIDLLRCQKACHSLDSSKDIEMPKEKWYWPRVEIKRLELPKEESDDETSGSDSEEEQEKLEAEASLRLEELTKYLRNTHNYCHWCGTSFDDEKDLKESCPGATRDDH
ncbi:G patch domain-containing protein 11-like [Ctenocephalides felis]|uniref:G patch domain-containing protein 11-like n=1 Tax=Ctenocephalides felis TaxID=7515 RepID=UPI000E6E3DC1|nr:G patch domain-containing protein 11-like [Ctenocephalides felis]